MISLLLRFIRAEREGNWQLHVHMSSFAGMLPWFRIYDNTNYTRWGSIYLADMHQLELKYPAVYQDFIAGNSVVKQTKTLFNQLSTDQAFEHVNEDSARDRWCLTFNHRSQLVTGIYEPNRDEEYSVWESKEGNPGRIARYESDVRHIQEQLSRFNTFRFLINQRRCN